MFGYLPNYFSLLVVETAWSSLMAEWACFTTQEGLKKIFINTQGTQYWGKCADDSAKQKRHPALPNGIQSYSSKISTRVSALDHSSSWIFAPSLGPDSYSFEQMLASGSRMAAWVGAFHQGRRESLGSRTAGGVRAGAVCHKADLILIRLNHDTWSSLRILFEAQPTGGANGVSVEAESSKAKGW